MDLSRFPRESLAHLPTPLEPLERLSAALGGPEIWIKRDDCTGLSTGGNKARKLEFLMGEARAQAADLVVTMGGVQSNHARQTAAAAAKLGMGCHLVLENSIGDTTDLYLKNGNLLLDFLHGASWECHPTGGDLHSAFEGAVRKISETGIAVYAIPSGGSNETGALGYASAAAELVGQCDARGLKVDHVVHATGSAGTQAGLVSGLKAIGRPVPVLGISVKAARQEQKKGVLSLAQRMIARISANSSIDADVIEVDDGYVGDGYGLPTPAAIEAIDLFARLEGILLDPVYTGKAAAGLIGLIRRGRFKRGQRIVFLHTGGVPALFAYRDRFDVVSR